MQHFPHSVDMQVINTELGIYEAHAVPTYLICGDRGSSNEWCDRCLWDHAVCCNTVRWGIKSANRTQKENSWDDGLACHKELFHSYYSCKTKWEPFWIHYDQVFPKLLSFIFFASGGSLWSEHWESNKNIHKNFIKSFILRLLAASKANKRQVNLYSKLNKFSSRDLKTATLQLRI